MKITLILTGNTENNYIAEGFRIYEKRLKHYISFQKVIIPDIKNSTNLSSAQLCDKEAEILIQHLVKYDLIILLDEKGFEYSSVEFAGFLQKNFNKGIKNLLFVIGGAYGFSEKIYKMGYMRMALSKMTFSHQFARLIFIEQLYRAMSILKNEPYHH